MTRTILVAAVFVFACRGNDATPVDSPPGGGGSDAMGSGSGSGSADTCTSYTTDTIATMRQAKSGCYELDNVVSLALSSSTTNPKLFVEDAAGGMYSAMVTECESHSTTHPCSVVTTVTGIAVGHSVTIKGTYIKTSSTTFEEFFIDSITDNGATTAIPAATAQLADIERSGSNAGLRFQYVSVAAGTLKMYDWTPAEFDDTTATSCPYVTGFGMIPSTVSVTEGAACTGSAAQPAGQSPPNSAEVLIGTDFYKSFLPETDCKCATGSDVPETSSTVTGTVKGILMFDVPFGGTTGYYYLEPTNPTDFPISPVAMVP